MSAADSRPFPRSEERAFVSRSESVSNTCSRLSGQRPLELGRRSGRASTRRCALVIRLAARVVAGGTARSQARQAAPDCGPAAHDHAGVVVEDADDVGSCEDDAELEGELRFGAPGLKAGLLELTGQ
jgi:hypothetical protein